MEEEHGACDMGRDGQSGGPGCDGDGDEDGGEGDEAGNPWQGVAAAAIVEKVGTGKMAAAVFDPAPTGEDDALLAGFDGLHHVYKQLEPFFRSSGGVELFPVHSLRDCGFVLAGFIFWKVTVDLNEHIAFGKRP